MVIMDGLDGLSAGRQFVDNGNIEVAIQSHGQSARNGSGRHHKYMGRTRVLVPEFGALLHTKSVLLVNDGQTQIVKTHSGLDECMSAYEQMNFAALDGTECLCAFGRCCATGEQCDAQVHISQERTHGGIVLLCQNLCGGHEAGLKTIINGYETAHECYHGFSGTDIALQQTVHLTTASHVVAYLTDDTLLGFGERKR